jgi:hypothetical protein
MSDTKNILTTGLTAAQIKWIALIFMTIDHLGAYGYGIPIFAAHYMLLRTLGRIAAPLFLYMLAESARHTGNRNRFLLRLYLAAVAVGLFYATVNHFFGKTVGAFSSGNIIFTLFYTVLYIYILEGIFTSISNKSTKQLLGYTAALAATYLPHLLHRLISNGRSLIPGLDKHFLLQKAIAGIFLPSPLLVEYSLIFLLLGAALYFARRKTYQIPVFFLFCALSYCGAPGGIWRLPFTGLYAFPHFFNSVQNWMVLALPFMFFYNGKRGEERKWFFYVYYPLHRYLLFLLQAVFYL